MAHIYYDKTKPIAGRIAALASRVIEAKAEALRIKTVLDGLTTGGTVLTAIEVAGTADGNAMVSAANGSGAALYNAVVSIKSGLDSIAQATVGDLDLG